MLILPVAVPRPLSNPPSSLPQFERQVTTSSVELSLASLQVGRSQESLVLQLYGIAKPCV